MPSKQTFKQINFLASGHFRSFTEYVDDSHPDTVTIEGHTILPAGSVYPLNDATAEGITIDAVDVTEHAQPVGVIVEGYILQQRLPKPLTDAAKTAMKEIKYRDKPASTPEA